MRIIASILALWLLVLTLLVISYSDHVATRVNSGFEELRGRVRILEQQSRHTWWKVAGK